MTASARPHLQLVPDRLDAAAVGDDADGRCLPDTVRGQPRQDRFRVLVAGEAKHDKCTARTQLVGRDVPPTGVVPVTALATTVRGGGPEGLVLRSTDGRVGQHDVHKLTKHVTQAANPGNRLGIAEAVLRLHAPLPADGVELDRWRGRQEQLTALHRRLCDRLARDLDTLRDTVADLLGVALVLPQDGGPLLANPRFPYQFAEDLTQTELLAGWIRRHLPGGYGKKRPRAHLARETADPVPMQVGRTRSDLQQRLAESIRPVERAVPAHYEAVAGRLRVVLDEARHPAPAGEQLGTALADRASTLRPILAELTALDGGSPVARSGPGR